MYPKRTTSYLLLFQGYPPVLGATRRQHPHRRSCLQQSLLNREVTNKPHESGADHPQKPKHIFQRDGSRDADDRLRDLPEWLEEFTDNLEDTEVHAPAHISQDSDLERLTKVHSMYTHFPKDRNCEVCLRTNMTRALCRRRPG